MHRMSRKKDSRGAGKVSGRGIPVIHMIVLARRLKMGLLNERVLNQVEEVGLKKDLVEAHKMHEERTPEIPLEIPVRELQMQLPVKRIL